MASEQVARGGTLEHVFSPIQIGPVTVPNRVARQGVALRYFPDIKDELIAHHEARARGGLGLTILELGRVHTSTYHPWELDLTDPKIVDGYRRLMERLSRYPIRVFQETAFYGRGLGPGRRTGGPNGPGGGGPAWSPSAVPEPGGATPIPMTRTMIESVVEGWHDTASRIRDGGLHGVEVHCSHGHLMQQFLSPLVNRRTDEYGGSPENRIRFLREVLAAVRSGAGPGLAVGIRIGHDEGVPGGLTVEDMTWIVKTLETEGAIDYVNIGIGNAQKPHTTVAGTSEPPGYQVAKSGAIARAVDVPAIVTGRIMDLEQAEAIIASGQAELVSMVRALHADPDLINKTREGRKEDVRPCISCNHGCYAPIRSGQVSTCTVNPATGFELRLGEELIERAGEPRRVLVVGGGPAGLEAARVAALRGHEVSLYEAGERLGGQLDLTRRAPLRGEFGLIVDWLERQLRGLGVRVRTGVTVTGALVAAERPDLVVVATGATPRRDGFQSAAPMETIAGAEGPNVYTGWDVLDGSAQVGRTMLVFDDLGHYEGIAIVDALFAAGVETVHFVTRTATLAPAVESSAASAPARERFGRRNFRFHPTAQLVSVEGGEARLRDLEWGRDEAFGFDAAVLLCGYQPNQGLAAELNPGGDWIRSEQGAVHRSPDGRLSLVGDALSSPRYLTVAIHEGHHAARWA